jgi:hypothetical protein
MLSRLTDGPEQSTEARQYGALFGSIVGRSFRSSRRGFLGSSRFPQRFAKQKFDLPVQAAEVVVGPTAHGLHDLRVDSQWKILSHW